MVNRHIPTDWQKFYVEPHSTRRMRLCGSKGIDTYEGIPGITPQALGVAGRFGWCIKCMEELFTFYNNNYKKIVTIPEAHAVYNIIFFEMLRHMRYVAENLSRS